MRGTRPAQVEVAVAQARLLTDGAGVLRVVGDLEGQRGRLGEDLHGGVDDLDLTGGQVLVLVASGRRETVPVTLTTVSLRSACASSSRTTTWTIPEASRRSMKATPP